MTFPITGGSNELLHLFNMTPIGIIQLGTFGQVLQIRCQPSG
ncbi:hypothetical protein [Aeromonas hydrophila]|nr:hypothetical protein [Aeromonas hydrophila]